MSHQIVVTVRVLFCNQMIIPCSPWTDGSRSITNIIIYRAVKKFLSSRLITNSRRLWNSHTNGTSEASRDILKFRVSEMVVPGVFKRYFPPRMACCFVRMHARLGTIAIEISQAFNNIARFECFTDLNLFK